jgi:hypothetical protein
MSDEQKSVDIYLKMRKGHGRQRVEWGERFPARVLAVGDVNGAEHITPADTDYGELLERAARGLLSGRANRRRTCRPYSGRIPFRLVKSPEVLASEAPESEPRSWVCQSDDDLRRISLEWGP